jgi:hypothetical protein
MCNKGAGVSTWFVPLLGDSTAGGNFPYCAHAKLVNKKKAAKNLRDFIGGKNNKMAAAFSDRRSAVSRLLNAESRQPSKLSPLNSKLLNSASYSHASSTHS